MDPAHQCRCLKLDIPREIIVSPWHLTASHVILLFGLSTLFVRVWCGGLTTFLLCAGPLLGNSYLTLQSRHNGRDGVSNYQPRCCLLNSLFRRRSQKTSKLRVTGLCAGNSPVTGEFPAQMASNAENIFTWWRHHEWQLVCKYNFFVRLNFVSEIVLYFCQMLLYPPFL